MKNALDLELTDRGFYYTLLHGFRERRDHVDVGRVALEHDTERRTVGGSSNHAANRGAIHFLVG